MIRVRTLLVLLAVAVTAAAQEHPYVTALKDGDALFEKEDYEGAAAAYTRAIEIMPTDWRGHYKKIVALVYLADRSKGRRRASLIAEAQRQRERMVGTAVERWTDPLAYFLEGYLAGMKGDAKQAYTALDRARRRPAREFEPYEEIRLRAVVMSRFARAAMGVARELVLAGDFEAADPLIEKAERWLPGDDPDRMALERMAAAVDEALARYGEATRHLRRAMELAEEEETRLDFLGSIVLVHAKNKEIEKAEEVLAEAPDEAGHPTLVLARCLVQGEKARLDPESGEMGKAIRLYQEAIAAAPKDERYLLTIYYGDLLLESKIDPGDPKPDAPLIRDQIERLLVEAELRPECPPIYWQLYRFHKLLGNVKEAARYQRLHEEKSKAFEHKDRFDRFGRPRC